MKIAFDARMIDHPGIGRYIKNLLSFMMLQEKEAEFVLYGEPEKLSGFKTRKEDYRVPAYNWKEFIFNPFAKEKFDLVHIPHFNAPFNKKAKLVVTIHDLMYLRFKEAAPSIKRLAARLVIINALKKADKIIAVSQNTAKDIIELCPEAKARVKVIYEAAESVFKKIIDKDKLEQTKRKYALPDLFILFVGSLKRHKNIERLLEAYRDLKSRGVKHRLVIVGRYRPQESEILSKIKTTDALYIEEVSSDDLVAIYTLASLLAFPSLYEGFGLPVLEAMACGTPVVVSSATSLPEVAGDAGVLCNPLDCKDISDKIYKVINDVDFSQRLIGKGLKRASMFSWGRTAIETLDLYKEIAK